MLGDEYECIPVTRPLNDDIIKESGQKTYLIKPNSKFSFHRNKNVAGNDYCKNKNLKGCLVRND